MNEKIFDLPDAVITFVDQLFNEHESDRLFDLLLSEINWRQDKIKMFGKLLDQPRLTAWFGDPGLSYTYSGILMHPQPWTETLSEIKQRVDQASGIKFSSVLLNLYRDGQDSMGWHQDNEKELGVNPVIASVSFGQTRPFQMKHIYNKELKRVDIPLSHGSLLLMKGSTQHFWKHQIPKTKRSIEPRINLTFRVIKA